MGTTDKKPAHKTRDPWDWVEIASKIVGGISIPVIGIAVTILLQQQSEANRRAQLEATITAEREKADSDVRAHMLDALLQRYLGEIKSNAQGVDDFRDRIMVLDLVQENFGDYFNAKPLFGRLFEQIKAREHAAVTAADAQPWFELGERLKDVAIDASERQVASLENAEALTGGDLCLPSPDAQKQEPLYSTVGLDGFQDKLLENTGPVVVTGDEPMSHSVRHSLSLDVDWNKSTEDAAYVNVRLFQDQYNGKTYASSILEKNIQFPVSYFTTPYLDNTRLLDGSRFSVLYRGCSDSKQPDAKCRFPMQKDHTPVVCFAVVTFNEKFLNQRDRPYVDKLVNQALAK